MHWLLGKGNLWFAAGGLLGALLLTGSEKVLRGAKPVAVSLLKEGYSFKEWLATRYDLSREEIEDVLAEARHEYEQQARATDSDSDREDELLARLDAIIQERKQPAAKAKAKAAPRKTSIKKEA